MTIRNKVFIVGFAITILFLVFAIMNIRMHYEVARNLSLRDQHLQQLESLQNFTRWRNSLIRLVSDVSTSGHVPAFSNELLELPSGIDIEKSQLILDAAKKLVFLIQHQEKENLKIDAHFMAIKKKITDLYIELDDTISTMLAIIQMDKVMGREAPEKASVAPFVLKSLNQITLVSMDSIISKNFSDTDKGIIDRNRRFLNNQLAIIDTDGHITDLFNSLFAQITELEISIPSARQTIAMLSSQIHTAKQDFDQAIETSDINTILSAAELEATAAHGSLEKSSRNALIFAFLILVIIPVLMITAGILGLNALIIGPITVLAKAIKRFQAGDYETKVSVKRQDEIGELAEVFNAMAADIQVTVTSMARLNVSLKESESRYRTLVEHIPQAIFLKNTDLLYISINEHFARDLGKSSSEIIGKTGLEIYPESQADNYLKQDEVILQTKEAQEFEEAVEIRGQKRHILKIKTPVVDTEGTVIGVLGIYSDITDRKQTEMERERLIAAIKHASDAILVTDVEGIIQYVNPSFEQTTGYISREVLGNQLLMLESSIHSETFYLQIWRTIRSGQTWHGRLHVKRKKGTDLIVEASISPIRDARQEIVSFVAVSRDITNEIEMEKRLRQAQKMEAIGNLAGGIAHDFNNILFPIIGMSELLLEDLPNKSLEYEKVYTILKAGQRASELVRQILSFSRQSEYEMMPVRLQSVLKEVLKLCRSTIPTNIEIDDSIQQDCGSVWANATQLHQVGMNLITNAYHAVENKNGKIAIELKEILITKDQSSLLSLGQGKYARLSISDNGTGMTPDIIERLFEPYFTTKEKRKGTGLGLAVVYGIIKSLAGEIKIYSEPGAGTTFNIYLPVMEMPNSEKTIAAAEKLPMGNERILLVDDEIEVVRVEKQILERLGYKVSAYENSLEAVEAFKAEPQSFDLIISDMAMPNMTGDQLSETMRMIRSDIPVIICTGFSENINKEKAQANGVNGFIMKPVNRSDLAKIIRNVLDEAKHDIS